MTTAQLRELNASIASDDARREKLAPKITPTCTVQLRNKIRGGRCVGNAWHVLLGGEVIGIFDERADAEALAENPVLAW